MALELAKMRRDRILEILAGSLLVSLLVLAVARAGLESSIWLDETATLGITNLPIHAIPSVSTVDFSPPGYYLLLATWLRLVRAVGVEPSILWARLPGVLVRVLLAVASWLAGRRLLGRAGGPLLAVAVAGSANAATMANDARAYSVASVALAGCFLILLVALPTAVSASATTRPRALTSVGLWPLYAACASVALWTHALSAIALACLGLLWLALAARAGWRSTYALGGAAAHLAAVLAFVPWLAALEGQRAALDASAADWMTPPTFANLARVFVAWLPYGRIVDPANPPAAWISLVGVLTLTLPLAGALLAVTRSSARDSQASLETTLAVSGLAVATSFVVTLWWLRRADLLFAFHGPRYPALMGAPWAAGLVGLSCLVARRVGGLARVRDAIAWLLLAPWLVASCLGQILSFRVERHGGLATELRALGADAPPPGARVYVMPSRLASFHAGALAPFEVEAIERLPCDLAGSGDAWVLDLNQRFAVFDRVTDLVARRTLTNGSVATDVRRTVFPSTSLDYELDRLRGVRADRAEALCKRGWAPVGRGEASDALAVAVPEEQRYPDGWSFPEVNDEGVVYRWAVRDEVTVRFDRPLPAGRFLVRYRGYRAGSPEDPAPMSFTVGDAVRRTTQAAGGVDVSFEVELEHAVRRPALVVRHPTWRQPPGAADQRTLASAFILAEITRAPP